MSHQKIKRAKNFNRKKTLENNRAQIVVGWQFKTSASGSGGFERYLDYTQRQSATDVWQDYGLEKLAQYAKFVDYTQRATATRTEDRAANATFDDRRDSLTVAAEKTLRQNLRTAQKNGSPLWQGYISFSTKWLIEQHVYDPATGRVNQGVLRNAVRQSMRQLLRQEQFNQTAFWWGDIQFDTNHIHIHLGLSETHSSRPIRHGRRVGKLQQKSLTQFKSNVTRRIPQLTHSAERSEERLLQKVIGQHKREVVTQVALGSHQLKIIERALPAEQKWWRASQINRPEMREADRQTRQFLRAALDGLPEYQDCPKRSAR